MRPSNNPVNSKLLFIGLLLCLSATAISGTRLSLEKISATRLEVVLSNDEPVAAIQFTLNSSGPVFVSAETGSRLENSGWVLLSNRVSESVLNVVLIRSGSANLPEGEGAITRVAVSASSSGIISLTRVVVASPEAMSIFTTLEDLEWFEFSIALGQNFPNPFNPATTIPYTIEEQSTVSLAVYDVSGREIKRMINEQKTPGSYLAVWNGTDERGFQVPSGVYFVRLQAGVNILTRKMILTK